MGSAVDTSSNTQIQVYHRGNHKVIDFTNAVVVGGAAEVDAVATALVERMATAAREAGANVLMTHHEVFDGATSPPGFASVVLLDESHLSAHCYSDEGLLAVDVFTCGKTPATTDHIADSVLALVKELFPNSSAQVGQMRRFKYEQNGPMTCAAPTAGDAPGQLAEIARNEDTAAVARFIRKHFRHFNAAAVIDAADGYRAHLQKGGKMFVTLAGAMSTGEIGISLAEMIRGGKVHGLSVTGANLEEDFFNLIAHKSYKRVPDYRSLSRAEEQALYDAGMNRVTDTCIPEEEAFRRCEAALTGLYQEASANGERLHPHELFYRLIRRGTLEHCYEIDPKDSWLIAAAEADLPIVVPGWEDSTCGNIIVAAKIAGEIDSYPVKSGLEQMERLVEWYTETSAGADVGFFQIGGGIAGDFPVCVVPLLRQDLRRNVKLWSYFAQISDGTTSYGGYSAAPPNEKITWGKLAPETPSHVIESDATIVWPLVCALVLSE